jgi:hypothetical protein
VMLVDVIPTTLCRIETVPFAEHPTPNIARSGLIFIPVRTLLRSKLVAVVFIYLLFVYTRSMWSGSDPSIDHLMWDRTSRVVPSLVDYCRTPRQIEGIVIGNS